MTDAPGTPPAPDPVHAPAPGSGPRDAPLPYRSAVLCVLFDAQGRLLLLHRRKPPNADLYSPIGGKLELDQGESPTACAVREIHEEAGVQVSVADLRLAGLVSETAYEGQGHWLMFVYEVTRPVDTAVVEFDEGRLEWRHRASLEALPLPVTDREIIWPVFWRYRDRGEPFAVHIDCRAGGIRWRVEQPPADAHDAWQTVLDQTQTPA
ncbi:MAG: NUDIX domain-containing protein [Planctomycetota bacterium]